MTTRCHTRYGSFDPSNPVPGDVCLEDIAHALSMTCRYGGACPSFYSVAQHACGVASMVFEITRSPEAALLALHHDDAEAYIHDIRRPIKNALIYSPNAGGKGAEMFSSLEERIMGVISEALLLPAMTEEWAKIIKDCDNSMLSAEMLHFWPGDKDAITIQGRTPYIGTILPEPSNGEDVFGNWAMEFAYTHMKHSILRPVDSIGDTGTALFMSPVGGV